MGEAAHDPLHESTARPRRTKQEQPRPLRFGEDHTRKVVQVALREVEELFGEVEILEGFSFEKEVDGEEVEREEILVQVFAEQESPLVFST